jgi:hypothetical protein
LDSIAAGSFDWWSRRVNNMFQNRYWKRDLFEMRKINPKSGIRTEMRLIRLNKVWLPCGDAYNWYSRLKYCIGSRFDLGFVRRSQHWCNQGRRHSRDWLSELNLGLPCPTRLASIHRDNLLITSSGHAALQLVFPKYKNKCALSIVL